MRRAIRPPVLAITGLLLVLAAVGLLARGAPSAAGSEEVVVYSARHYGQEHAFEEFTKQTGIRVQVFNGNTAELFEHPRADLFPLHSSSGLASRRPISESRRAPRIPSLTR